jgi:hypothetical protein
MAAPRRVSAEWSTAYTALTQRVATDFRANAYSTAAPDQIYHFTDCDGLIGILKTKTLWASLATSLNDRSEMEYGRVLAREVVGGFAATSLDLGRFETAVAKQTWRVYVVSFCQNADTALHWLHYGRSGSGAAIGFATSALHKTPYELCPVLYDRDRQVQWITRVIQTVDQALHAALTLTTTLGDRELLSELAVDLLATNLWMVTPRMKSAAFGAEQEWRLVTYVPRGAGVPMGHDPSGPTEFRAAGGRIVPYKKVVFDVLPMREIVLGSSSPMQQDPTALRLLLEENVADSGEVTVSDSKVLVRL